MNSEVAALPTSFSRLGRLPGLLSAVWGWRRVTPMLTRVLRIIVWSHEHVCSEVKDQSVYITCLLVTEELITAINMCLVLCLAFAHSLSPYIYMDMDIYVYIHIYICRYIF